MRKRLRAGVRTGTVVAMAALLALPATALGHLGDRTLSTGSTGHDVKVLQSWLTHMGFTTDVGSTFGRNTRWNVRRFEQATQRRIDGVVTPPDAAVMRRAMTAHYSYVSPYDSPTVDVA